ncbi:MAG: 8-hydroxy-5-deazaflavin:NADPH oxidoreductase [Thermoleophilaceae bacterium]|jgi:predicted dinucleotide-binding enzyme|nr:8-hydroxy-5-deazaflavin:NADPH oxidoreductase [Thermoleophilaceae bacterium]
MKIGVLGSGGVGQTIAGTLRELGHEVEVGTRSEDSYGTAAAHGEVIFNCTAGTGSLEALRAAGEEELRGKVLVDVANPLDFSKGMPPTLSVCNDDSLGEQIQREFPEARVVKALNTMSSAVMVAPVEGTNLFICGNDSAAKEQVTTLLGEFGWPADSVVDLGGIGAARGMEMYLPLWLALMGALGTPQFNIAVVR